MKYIKKFESTQDLPEVGDYVLMNSYGIDNVVDFITNNYGIFLNSYVDKLSVKPKIRVRYENIPGDIDLFFHDGTRTFDIDLLIAYGKTIEELEMKLKTKKFNL